MIGQSVGPYRLLSRLGVGGMGEVYLAEDTRLGRKVALKCPSETWIREGDARARLQREARAAARLNHPRIAAIHDVFEVGDCPWIVMEYVEGETLGALLQRAPLPVERAVVFGIELADALEAAHTAGVIHRDLKPHNIVVTGSGNIKVLDFGLAKTITAQAEDGQDGFRTHAGQMMGTPGYTPPEQLLGKSVDGRGDIYSLGAVLYEMLTGRPPYGQPDAMGRALAVLTEAVPSPDQINPAVPRRVSDVVARAMAREPSDRFQSAGDLRLALQQAAAEFGDSPTVPSGAAFVTPPIRRRWPLALAVILMIAAAGVPLAYWWKGRSAPAVTSAEPALPIIAVLPFQNLTGDASLDYLGAGMAETVSTSLASLSSIAVLGRSDIHETLERTTEPKEVRRALGASYVVEGAIQKSGDRLQVNMNLLGPEGLIVPAGIYDDDYVNLFDLQRRLAEALSIRVAGTLSEREREQLARSPTTSIDAMSSYWQGRAMLDQRARAGAVDAAVAHFTEAIGRDARFALAHAGLGDALWARYAIRRDEADARAALTATERARELDPGEPLVRVSLAQSYEETGRDEDAIAELQALLQFQPNSDRAHRMLARILARQGRPEEAIRHFQRAIAIRPGYWQNHSSLGAFYFRRGRFAEAAIEFQRVTELQPDNSWAFANLGAAYHSAGDYQTALVNYQQSIAIAPSDVAYVNLGAVYHHLGRYDDAVAVYQKAIDLAPGDPLAHRNMGDAYRRMGDRRTANGWYESAIALSERILSINPGDSDALGTIALCEAKLGRFDRARAHAADAVRAFPSDASVLTRAAAVEALAGEKDGALALLERAVASGRSRALIRDDEDFAGVRADPRFRRLVTEGD